MAGFVRSDASSSQAEAPGGCPLQIVRTGDESDNYSFKLEEENLESVLSKVPEDMKVAVVSVVGAFRTGKSFLLSFFLRYLRHADETGDTVAWMTANGAALREGNLNTANGGEFDLPKSFAWRGGIKRQTTGIWMWSEPFVRSIKSGEKVSVLLVDTQGMFDNETSMGLTACIFGLSTLLSSYQIYNVEKRVQEDHLQQLALFSEYGRMALVRDSSAALSRNVSEASSTAAAGGLGSAGAVGQGRQQLPANGAAPAAAAAAVARTESSGSGSGGGGGGSNSAAAALASPVPEQAPFQRVEFLVRDWQDFEADDDADVNALRQQMDEYLAGVVSSRSIKDLQSTREQITACFQRTSCFGLPHPGFDVIKKTYDGSIDKINPLFRKLLDAYVRQVFGQELEAKRIQGRDLTAPELRTYISAYVKLFQDGANFPEARTMLEATASANNANAAYTGLAKYKKEMDLVCGPSLSARSFLTNELFEQQHTACREAALAVFDSFATMGPRHAIAESRAKLEADVSSERERYQAINAGRNPFQNFEFYIVPLVLAVVALVARWVADATCSPWSDVCRRASHGLSHVYIGIFTFLFILSFGRIKQLADHLARVLPVLLGNAVSGGGGGAGSGGGSSGGGGHLKAS